MDISQEKPKNNLSVRLLQGVVVADKTGKIRSVNDVVCRTFGYTKKDLVGGNVRMLMGSPYREQHDHYMQSFLDTGCAKVMGTTRVVFGQNKSGKIIKIRLSLSFLPNEEDSLFCALLEELVDHSFIVRADEEGKILSATGVTQGTIGYSPKELIGMNLADICPPAVAQNHKNFMKNYIGPDQSKIIGEVRNLDARHSDGHLFPICLEVRQESSDPRIFSGKITEVEATLEAVVTVSRDKKIVSASHSCKTLFGYKADELVGNPISIISPHVRLRNGENVVACQHKDGSNFFLNVSITKFELEGQECFRGVLKRALAAKPLKPNDGTEEYIFTGDLLGWYEISKTLGSGYFGKVKMGIHRLTRLSVAVKTLKKKQYADAGMQYPPREVSLIEKLNHPNICRLYDTIVTEDALYMITELVLGGEMFDYIAHKNCVDEDEARHIMRQLVSATDYMHRSGIVHRDLKMENIMLDDNGHVKVIDLGLGNFFDATGENLLSTFCGSADYAAPELWKGKNYTGPEVDVWSLGVILFVITTGFIPFNDSTHVIQITYHWPKNMKFSDSLKELVGMTFQPAATRCTINDMIAHPWLNDHGKLPEITKYPVKLTKRDVNNEVVTKMEKLGFLRKDVEKAIIEDAHNQLTTTYYLLEHEMEKNAPESQVPEQKRFRKGSLLDSTGSVSSSDSNHSENNHCAVQ